jgi:hypothetical protein
VDIVSVSAWPHDGQVIVDCRMVSGMDVTVVEHHSAGQQTD